MTLQEVFIGKVEYLIRQTQKMLDERQNNIEGMGTVAELEVILNDLRRMKAEALKKTYPAQKRRFVIYDRFVAQKWDIKSDYSKELLDVSTMYISSL